MSKIIMFKKRYRELKMGHFGEIRLADPVFSAVVLPTVSTFPNLHFVLPSGSMGLPSFCAYFQAYQTLRGVPAAMSLVVLK